MHDQPNTIVHIDAGAAFGGVVGGGEDKLAGDGGRRNRCYFLYWAM